MGRGPSDKSFITFNSGEFSPLLDSRSDLDKAGSACRKLENFLIETYGLVKRRNGTQYIATTKFSGTRKSTEWRFQFSTTTSYLIEVGHEYFRFFANGNPVLSGMSPYEISSPYQEADLFEIQYTQLNDVIYITHPGYPQHKLSRVANTNWVLEEILFTNPAFLDENLTAITLTPATGGSPGEIALSSSAPLFNAGHVGSWWRIGHKRNAQSLSIAVSSNLSSTAIEILGKYFFRSYGVWSADILVQRSLDGGANWETLYRFKGASDRNVDGEGEALENGLYRIKVENYVSNTGGRFVLEATDAIIYGVLQVTAYVDSTNVLGETFYDFYSVDPSDVWSEGAWSTYRGFPRTVVLHEQRLVFGGTSLQPSTFWGSVIDDYENFLRGVADDAAYVFTLSGVELNAIQWMASQTALLIGTTGGEWRAISRSSEKGITPSAIDVKQQSSFGSEYIRALLVNDVVIFVQRKGKVMNELVADAYTESTFKVANLTLLAEHICKAGIVQMARQIDPISTIWCVMKDGTLAALTYDRVQNVVGWHRHPTDGFVESVCTIYGDNDADDEVWITVKRNVQAADVRFIERINPAKWVNKEDCFFVDAGATYSGAPATVISGITWLEGRYVTVLADAKVVEGLAVVSGAITLPFAASKVQVGLGFTSTLVPFRIDVDANIGASAGRMRKLTGLVARFMDTLGCRYSADGSTFYELPFRESGQPLDETTPLFTGDKEFDLGSGFARDQLLTIQQDKPLPMTVLALLPEYVVTGK